MTKVVVKLQFDKDKHKNKAMKIASEIGGLNSISMDKDMKLTVTGDFDPVELTEKLRKLCCAEIVSVGPEKETKTEDPKPTVPNLEPPLIVYHPPPPLVCYYQRHHPMEAYCCGTCQEEDPNGCVIC